MSKSIQRIGFGQIDNCPVVIGDGKTYIYNATSKRWGVLPEQRKPEVIPIQPATFLRRFGALIDRLPMVLREVALPLRIATDGGKTVGFCRSGSSGLFGTREGGVAPFTASAEVTQIEPFIAKRRRQEGTFDLGRHQYSAGPGFSWSCEYRIIRLDDEGQEWDVLSTSEESDGYESMGTHSLEAAQEYFDSVRFHISRERWEAMGAKFLIEEPDDDSCIVCGGSLSESNRIGFHVCEVDC